MIQAQIARIDTLGLDPLSSVMYTHVEEIGFIPINSINGCAQAKFHNDVDYCMGVPEHSSRPIRQVGLCDRYSG